MLARRVVDWDVVVAVAHDLYVDHRGESLYQYPKLDALPAAQRMQDCWASYIICRSLLLLLRRYITAWLSISHRRSAASKPIHTGYSKSELS